MTFLQRAIGAARLSTAAFEEVEADRGATGQALTMVVLSSTAAGIGLSSNVYDGPVLTLIALALLLWVLWAALTYAIGAHLIPERQTRADVGELLRTIGFAASPGVLRAIGFVPGIGPTLYALATVWMLVAMVIAIRQALDYTSTARAAAVCLVGGVIAMAMTAAIGGLVLSLIEELFS